MKYSEMIGVMDVEFNQLVVLKLKHNNLLSCYDFVFELDDTEAKLYSITTTDNVIIFQDEYGNSDLYNLFNNVDNYESYHSRSEAGISYFNKNIIEYISKNISKKEINALNSIANKIL